MRKETRKYVHRKPVAMPAKYQSGFLNRMSYTTTIYNNLKNSFNALVADMGGLENISRIEFSLCERFVYIEMLIRNLETEGANGDEEKFLEKYIKLSNSLNSVCAKLGISKRSSGESELAKYLDEQE